MIPNPPKKALKFTLDFDAHDRADIADGLRSIAWEIETEKSSGSVSSRGWSWRISEQSDLTRREYEDALMEWFAIRRSQPPTKADNEVGGSTTSPPFAASDPVVDGEPSAQRGES